jgi:hypothetical protein
MQGIERVTLSTLFALLLGYGLMQMGNTFQSTLLSIRGGIEGFSPPALHKRTFVVQPAIPVATTLQSEHSAGGSFEKAPVAKE